MGAAGAAGAVGAAGASGVTASEVGESEDVPMRLVAVTLNVYAVPLAKPVTVHVNAVAGDGEQDFDASGVTEVTA